MLKVQPDYAGRLDFNDPPTAVGGIREKASLRFVGRNLTIHRLPSVGFRFLRTYCLTTLALIVACAAAIFPQSTETISGTLPDTTTWRVHKPASWNGTLILDLDGGGANTSNPVKWLLAHGYAYGGTTRGACGYDFPHCVDNLLIVRKTFIEKFNEPTRTLALGSSRGAFVARLALELQPKIFAGALIYSGGGAGSVAVLNAKLDAVFALKTLVNPQAPLPLVNIADVQAANAALTALLNEARATPQGRARLALAASFEQFARWTDAKSPEPAPTNYEAQLDQIAASFVFANPAVVRQGVEKVAGGNVSWNNGVNYQRLLEQSGMKAMVAALYRKAGLDLRADLAKLANALRISADLKALAKIEPLVTYTGRISAPIINVDNDDPVDPAPHKLAYLATLKRARTDHLFRMCWVRGAGHGGQTELDRVAGFVALIHRLDTGRWGDTSATAMNALATKLAGETELPLGAATFIEHQPPKPLRTWDQSNWGRYKP